MDNNQQMCVGPAGTTYSEKLETAKEAFRKALVDKFGDSDLVKEVMKTIGVWENP